jgi:hypothetical protein
MTIGSPQSFRGGQGLVEWLFIAVLVGVAIATFIFWRS